MVKWLRALAALSGTPGFHSQPPNVDSHHVTSVSEDLVPSSVLWRHWVCTWYTDIPASKIPIYKRIKRKIIKKFKVWREDGKNEGRREGIKHQRYC